MPLTCQALSQFVPVACVLLPVVLTLYIVRKARRVAEADRVALWFFCVRLLRWLVIGTLSAWWAATDWLRWQASFDAALRAHAFLSFPGGHLLARFVFWLPPLLAVLLCQVLFQPVYSGVRGISWTRSELARQMIYSLGSTVLPLVLLLSGFTGVFAAGGGLLRFAFAAVLAFACAIFFGRRLRKLLQLSPNALTTGELRDRAFFLAAQLGVKLQQVYLLPPGKSRLANAFARSGRSIVLTQYLLGHLTRKEVDAVISHELAHLQKDHPRFLGLALLGGYAAVALPYFLFSPAQQAKPLFDLLFVAVPLLTYYFVARRFEFIADATAVGVTGDPESMITCLVKIHRLNSLPLEWSKFSEKLLTHPSTVRRAQAIARAGNLSEQRVAQLLSQPDPSPDSQVQHAENSCLHYPLATSGSGAPKVFCSDFKQSLTLRCYLLLFAMVTLLPIVLLRICDRVKLFHFPFLAFVFSLVVSVAALLLLLNFLPFFGSSGLARNLRARAETEGMIPPDVLRAESALLVGLSPGPAPRIFDGNYSWDAGYFFVSGDRLCYLGEESRFSLRRDQLAAVQLGPGFPGWFRARSLYLVWRNSESGASAIFNVRPLAVRSVFEMNRALDGLAERIAAWRAAAICPPASRPACEELPPPEVRAVTGTSLAEALRGRAYPALVIWAAFFSGLAASALGLPFAGFYSMFLPDSEPAASYGAISGWYAVVISCLLVLLLLLPLLRARDATVKLAHAAIAPPPRPM